MAMIYTSTYVRFTSDGFLGTLENSKAEKLLRARAVFL